MLRIDANRCEVQTTTLMRERERQKANSVQAPFVPQWNGTASLPVTNISVQAGPKARLDRPDINGIGASIINGQQGNPLNNGTFPLPHLPLFYYSS